MDLAFYAHAHSVYTWSMAPDLTCTWSLRFKFANLKARSSMDVKLSVSGISAMLKGKGIPDEFCKVFEGEFIAVCLRLYVAWRATAFDFISELPFV